MSGARLRLSRLGMAAVLVLAAGPTAAQPDAGVRSVFAYGAGNRALALGGAYTALADDASAALWNPGALGLLGSREFQASGADLYGLGMNEEYGALVWPSWRWGTGAVTFRRFAVDGIERRDGRNVLLPDELTDRETEFTLSYGKAVSDVWSLGGSVKMQRQSLAGYSANGVGVDLGLLCRPVLALGSERPWADRVTWGVAIFNAVEPSLQLDQEGVSDPVRLRTGVAYRQPLPRQMALIGAVDVEKTDGAVTDLHAGVEARVHPLLALRAGWNAGLFAAGSGVSWHGASFDYVFEDNPIETLHRFGVSYRFGPTVEESRQAHRRAEEERFRQRLAETFEERQSERVAELIRRAETLVQVARYDEALDIVAAVSALEPDNERARTLEARSLRGQAELREQGEDFAGAAILYGRALAAAPADTLAAQGLARCRTESDQRAARSQHIRGLFAAGLDEFTNGDLPVARQHFLAILEVDSTDTDTRAMLARTEDAIGTRVRNLLDQAERFLGAGLFDEARALLENVRALDPQSAGFARLTTQLAAAEQEAARVAEQLARAQSASPESATEPTAPSADLTPGAIAAAAPVPATKKPMLSKRRLEEIADLYQRGIEAMDDGRPDDALRYWELVWMATPNYENVAEFLKREYLLRGLDSFSRGDLDDAVNLWESALTVDPADEKTLGYLARAREQMMRAEEILGSER